jgi:hypothetical protein
MHSTANNILSPQAYGYLMEIVAYRRRLFDWHVQDIHARYLSQMPMRAVPAQSRLSAVIVECREHPLLEASIRNTLLFTPKEAGLQVFCGPRNLSLVQHILRDAPGANISLMEHIENLSTDDYSRLLKSPAFWSHVQSERVLVFQTDTLLLEPLQAHWFEYAYLGAPWHTGIRPECYVHFDSAEHWVSHAFERSMNSQAHSPCTAGYGNGGLSIRHRDLMQAVCEQFPDATARPEDLYFSEHVHGHFGVQPDISAASRFATESAFNPGSIGLHAAANYLNTEQLARLLEKHTQHVIGRWELHRRGSHPGT